MPTSDMARVFIPQYKTGCPEPCFRSSLFSVSTKWQSHFVEFTFFTVSEADGREKCKEWFRLWPKPTRTTGIAGRYESRQRVMIPLRHLLIRFVDNLKQAAPNFVFGAACFHFRSQAISFPAYRPRRTGQPFRGPYGFRWLFQRC